MCRFRTTRHQHSSECSLSACLNPNYGNTIGMTAIRGRLRRSDKTRKEQRRRKSHTQSFCCPSFAMKIPYEPKTKRPRQCVYGYRGTFEDAIKPLLFLYLGSSAIGTTFLAVLFKDATRPFLMSTTLHLLPEMLVWTHLIFPPHTENAGDDGSNQSRRSTIRWVYFCGSLVIMFGPVDPETGVIGTLVTLTYMAMAGVSDMLGVWLGLLMMMRRTHKGARRLGASFFVHGFAFHLTAYEFFSPQGNAFGSEAPILQGFGWIVLLLGTTSAFYSLFPIFAEPLDLRKEAPKDRELLYLCGGVLFSLLGVPLAATGGNIASIFWHIHHPKFLPTNESILTLYKICFPIMSCMFLVQLFNRYIDSGLPILPLHKNQQVGETMIDHVQVRGYGPNKKLETQGCTHRIPLE